MPSMIVNLVLLYKMQLGHLIRQETNHIVSTMAR